MSKFRAQDSMSLGLAMKPFVLAVADLAKANWLTKGGAELRSKVALAYFCNAINSEVGLAFQQGRAAGIEESAQEADHWDGIAPDKHKCGAYIAGAIRALNKQEPTA